MERNFAMAGGSEAEFISATVLAKLVDGRRVVTARPQVV
jgi:hypothetical protein